jgi:hypothetical protein
MCRNGGDIGLQLVEKSLKGIGTIGSVIDFTLSRNLVDSLKEILAWIARSVQRCLTLRKAVVKYSDWSSEFR